jgi:hypothetical protein
LYVVSLTLEGTTNSYPVQRLHALNITNGAEKFGGPIQIQASVAGTGSGSSNGQLAFDPKWNNQRPGLLFLNNTVYIGWGSHCDAGPWHGWLMGYSAASGALQQTSVFVTSPNGSGSGIWMSGTGLAADNINGNPRLFAASGNGNFDGSTEWGESVLDFNLTKGLTVQDSFTPGTQNSLTNGDVDLGSAGTILLPNQPGPNPHLAVQLSKAGSMYLLNRDNLGGYNTSTDNVVQEETFGPYPYGIWGAPAYFNNSIYFWPANANMMQYSLTNGVLASSPTSENSLTAAGTGGGYYVGTFQGATPSISANGTSNGIVWAVDTVRDQGNSFEYLYAFDATNVANTLWNSGQNPVRDFPGGSQKNAVPTIADGKVLVAGQNQLNVYGLLPAGFSLFAPQAWTISPGTSSTIPITVEATGGFSGTVSLGVSGLPSGVTAVLSAVSGGSGTLTLTAASSASLTTAAVTITGASGSLSASSPLQLSVANSVQPVSVNLSAVANVYGIFSSGTAPVNGGLDGSGYAYAASLLGSSVTANGVPFAIGAANQADGVSSVTVPLTAGNFNTLNLLATGVFGNQTGQPFVVTYSDGTTQTFTQSLSDWGAPSSNTGETVALTMPGRIVPSGSVATSANFSIYAYAFALNPAKTVVSVSLPYDRDVIVLGITLSGQVVQTNGISVGLKAKPNVYASILDGTAPVGGGLDGASYDYSGKLLPASINWAGTTISIGQAGTPNGVAAGIIALPAGTYTTLNLLATGVNTNQANQVFIVTYTDGTTQTFTQSVSDWGSPQNYSGETAVLSMAYRVTPSGSTQNGPWYLYGYSFALNSSKTVKSIALPNNRNVVVLGLALVAPAINLSSVYNVDATATDGTSPAGGGLDGESYSYSAKLLGNSVYWSGLGFSIAPTGAANGVSNATIALPAGSYASLNLLATGVNGNEPNQAFVVTYTDGTTQTFTQSVSDWGSPQNYPGESVAASLAYRVIPGGSTQSGPWDLYGYSFALNSSKTVKSITLPANRNVVVLAMAFSGPPISFTISGNVVAASANGTAPIYGGLDGSSYSYSATLLGNSLSWAGATYQFGAGGAALSGGTALLPAGSYKTLSLLGTGAFGGATNAQFVVTYTDGTTQTFTQSVSDWGAPKNYTGESIATTMAYRIMPNGSTQSGSWNLYGYSFPLNNSKTPQSVTFPANRNVVILSMDLSN